LVDLENKNLTRFEHWEERLPRFVNSSRKWDEVGIVKLHTDITSKIYDKAIVEYSLYLEIPSIGCTQDILT
jgi:hypothetical protein